MDMFPEECQAFDTRPVVPIGRVVRLLPSSILAASADGLPFQVVSWVAEWISLTHRGSGYHYEHRVGEQFHVSRFDSCRNHGQGMERFEKFSFIVDMCPFAYTTYKKMLIELRTYVSGLPIDKLKGFLVKMQTLHDTITDFTPPMLD